MNVAAERDALSSADTRIAYLEQQLAQLQRDNDGLRTALKYVINETVSVFDALERQTEAGRLRLDRTLTRSFTDSKLINELVITDHVVSGQESRDS